MRPDHAVVPLHVLGTDVDVRVTGKDPEALVRVLRDRWHLALRDGADRPAARPRPGAVPGPSSSRRVCSPRRSGPPRGAARA